MVMFCSCSPYLRNFLFAIASVMLLLSSEIVCAETPARQPKLLKVEGVVREPAGAPIAGVSVRLENGAGSTSQETTSDAAGRFVIASPTAGTYQLRIQKQGFREDAQTIVLPRKNSGPIRVVLARSDSQPTRGKSSEPMQFSDSTDFTVAGITDWTAAGGHGSDVNLRTSETLANDTRGLAGETSVGTGTGTAANSGDLLRRRDQLRRMLASSERADLHRQLGDVDEQLND